jgi:LmbE family N-acetylglucosaminyl deacetylase
LEPKKFDELMPKVVLGIAAHPDDLDFGASGSMAKWASQGAKCYYILCTDGSKGSDDPNLTSAQLVERPLKLLDLRKFTTSTTKMVYLRILLS